MWQPGRPFLLIWLVLLPGSWIGVTGDPVSIAAGQERPSGFRVVGYLPEYRLRNFDPEQAAFLTDLILFAAEPTKDGDLDLGKWETAPWDKFQNAKKKTGVRLILCVGGWGRSDHFPKMVSSPAARTRFVASSVSVLRKRGLDGMDLDWEHPRGAAEQATYAVLLEELKSAFRPHGLSLSLTIAPWKEIPARGYAAADTIQLMSYDYGQRHSTFEQAQKDVQAWIAKGIPPEKLVLGLPFYGRDVDDRTKAITYAEVRRRYGTPAASDETNNYFFNGPETIRRKTRMAIDHKIGGVMVWEIGQDTRDESSLLAAIRLEQKEPLPVKAIPKRSPVPKIPRRPPSTQ